MRKIFSDASLQRHFIGTGYARMAMLSSEEVTHILSRLPHLCPDDHFEATGRNAPRSQYHCSFLDTNIEYKRQTHNLIKGVFASHVERELNRYEILNCNFYVKPPGTGEFVIHQNWPAIADLNDTTVTIWCPLVDVVQANGALQFVVGSHKILPHVEGPDCPGFFRDFREALIQKYLKAIPMSAGEALIFDDGLIHWSANNDSDIARVAIQILCVPSGVQPVYFFYDRRMPDRFELIAVNSEFFITTDVTELTVRKPGWKSLGFVENRNRYPTEEEFADLLRRGDCIRAEKYGLGAV
jgi:phytanoyl-CoA dioxygenase PhyH